MRYFLLTLIPLLLSAATIKAPLLDVNDDEATVTTETVRPGTSGYILRNFNEAFSSIISNVRVTAYDAQNKRATLKLTPYDGLEQDSLPKGKWKPQKGDTAVLAHGYNQGLLIAPSKSIYTLLTEKNPGLNWIHPDYFAAHLSLEGHPTPLIEDIQTFCSDTSTGLLYLYLVDHLFTLDCSTGALLEILPMPLERSEEKLPFYSRLQSINADFFGEGSDELEQYDRHYLNLIETSNPDNKALQALLREQSTAIAEATSEPEARDISDTDAKKRTSFLDPK